MSDRKGILSKDNEKFLGEWLDSKIVLKGSKELYDGIVFKGLIRIIDDYAIDKLNDTVKDLLSGMVDAIEDKNWESALANLAELFEIIIDLPGVEDDEEAEIFQQIMVFILNIVQTFVIKETSETEEDSTDA